MNIAFSNKAVTVILSPVDLRGGYAKLTSFVQQGLGIDVTAGRDIVLFFNQSKLICKIVTADDTGTILITRKLHHGKFPKLMMSPEGKAMMNITIKDLENLLDGKPLQVVRSNFLNN